MPEHPALTWVDHVPSTQVALVAQARAGGPPQALATTHQTAGHGRRGREWVCPPGGGLAVSVLLRPRRTDGWTWLPLLTGVAVARAIDARRPPGTAPLTLKWPNDVLDANGAKLAGLLAERVDLPSVPAACVLGIGVNLASNGLPDGAVGLDALGVDATAHEMARSLLTEISAWVSRWERHDPIVQDSYRATCSTLGKTVRVTLPSGRDTTGVAAEIDADGCLVLDVEGSGLVALSAGDVVHVRRR